jgi:hypothetical protein
MLKSFVMLWCLVIDMYICFGKDLSGMIAELVGVFAQDNLLF